MYYKVLDILTNNKSLKTVEYISTKSFTIKATRRFKARKIYGSPNYHEDIVVTIGKPSYLTRAFIKKNPGVTMYLRKFPIKKKVRK